LLRDGELGLTESIADALLEMVDAIRIYLQSIESTQAEGKADSSGLITRLKALQEKREVPQAATPESTVLSNTAEDVPPAEQTTATLAPRAMEAPAPESGAESKPKIEESKEATIRVDVNLLEKQMNLVSELVLLRNRLLQIAADANERNLNSAVHGLNYVTSELRKNVMKTRMQPVSQLFDKLPRILRDVSKDLGKKVKNLDRARRLSHELSEEGLGSGVKSGPGATGELLPALGGCAVPFRGPDIRTQRVGSGNDGDGGGWSARGRADSRSWRRDSDSGRSELGGVGDAGSGG
jgi:chemotaxis protein histidine kinase CheA